MKLEVADLLGLVGVPLEHCHQEYRLKMSLHQTALSSASEAASTAKLPVICLDQLVG